MNDDPYKHWTPYKPANDNRGKWFPLGPDSGGGELSYYASHADESTRFEDEEECAKICKLMNLAYLLGRKKQAERIRKELGLN